LLQLFIVWVNCGKPRRVIHGQVFHEQTTLFSTATYKCNNGFVLVGNRTQVCGMKGIWEGSTVCYS